MQHFAAARSVADSRLRRGRARFAPKEWDERIHKLVNFVKETHVQREPRNVASEREVNRRAVSACGLCALREQWFTHKGDEEWGFGVITC